MLVGTPDIDKMIEDLDISIKRLEHKFSTHLDKINVSSQVEEQLQRINADRSHLANELDLSTMRLQKLLEVNSAISSRLVNIMEMVKCILDNNTTSDKG